MSKFVKRVIVFLIVILHGYAMSYAQTIGVASFKPDIKDMTAMHKGGVDDQNGQKCALIKVVTTQQGFSFDLGSSMAVVDTKVHPEKGEIWLYVPAHSRRMNIYHPQLGQLRDYTLPVDVESGRTYIMTLTTGTIITTINETAQKQYVVFNIKPTNASLQVNGEEWVLDEYGHAEKNMSLGTYSYKVTAKNYHETGGYVENNNPNSKQIMNVSLKPAFGWLEIPAESGLSGAIVFLDNERVGTVPFKSNEISSGQHRLKITKKLYKTYEETIVISDSLVNTLNPQMQANFAETTLKTMEGAEIYIDGELKGKGSWRGPLESGEYTVECKMAGHRPTSQVVRITPNTQSVIELRQPSPIYGSLEITSSPSNADVSINGKEMGQTPLFINNNLLIGSHKVTVRKQNYKEETKTVEVKENETENMSFKLNTMGYFTINSKPSGAVIMINGENKGTTPYKCEMASGDYQIVLAKKGCNSYGKTVHLDSSDPNVTITLEKRYFKPSMFYLGGGFQVGSMMTAGGFMGGFISNINIEADYLMGMNESEVVYWANNQSQKSEPMGYSYKATYIGGRIGYGIDCSNRFRLTPQVGLGSVQLKGTLKSGTPTDFKPENAYALSASIGVRADYALTQWLAVFARPEVSFAVKKTDTFAAISDVSSKVKGFGSGVNGLVGLYFYF